MSKHSEIPEVDYPQIELTDGSTIFDGRMSDRLGLKDVKNYFDRWFAYVEGKTRRYNDFPKLEVIKVMRVIYAFAYKAGQLNPEPAYKQKTYTVEDMHKAYLAGVQHGNNFFIDATRETIKIANQAIEDSLTDYKNCQPWEREELANTVAKGPIQIRPADAITDLLAELFGGKPPRADGPSNINFV